MCLHDYWLVVHTLQSAGLTVIVNFQNFPRASRALSIRSDRF